MPSTIKKCRVCGKEYEACRSANRAANVFRWQEVACSPKCGRVYLEQINESRGASDLKRKNRHKKPAVFSSAYDAPVSEEATDGNTFAKETSEDAE